MCQPKILHLRNLPFTADQSLVHRLFGSVASGDKAILDGLSQPSPGNAFASCRDESSAARAQAMLHGKIVHNRVLEVSFARPLGDLLHDASLKRKRD